MVSSIAREMHEIYHARQISLFSLFFLHFVITFDSSREGIFRYCETKISGKRDRILKAERGREVGK